jgi:hypothetical protein
MNNIFYLSLHAEVLSLHSNNNAYRSVGEHAWMEEMPALRRFVECGISVVQHQTKHQQQEEWCSCY